MARRILFFFGIASICVLALLYISTAFTQVKVQETGVVTRFGKVVRSNVAPGICVKLPWPFESLQTVETRSVHRLRAGFGEDVKKIEEIERLYGPIDQMEYGTLRVPYVLTGDKNIIHIMIIITYKVGDARQYLYEISDAVQIMGKIAQNAIINNVTRMQVDDALTTGKLQLRSQVLDQLRTECRHLNLGLDVVAIEIKNVRPPRTTSAAFRDVINAQEESAELIHQAESYQKKVLPEAHAEAVKISEAAGAYRNEVTQRAQGEAKRFEMLALEYKKNPAITRERLRLETVERILPSIRKFIVTGTSSNQPVKLRLFKSNPETE